ncbi:MAG: Rrf2 family transcriptional regulator [Leptospirales bacterium]|jgi:Rrf2 family protein
MAANLQFSMAVHVLAALAYNRGRLLSSEEIATSVGTNPVVIRRLTARLARAGIVETRRGKEGGVQLARSPGEICLSEVHLALDEESAFSVHPNPGKRSCVVNRKIKGILQGICDDVEDAVEDRLAAYSLCDVLSGIDKNRAALAENEE